jgi:hypothetical protein
VPRDLSANDKLQTFLPTDNQLGFNRKKKKGFYTNLLGIMSK